MKFEVYKLSLDGSRWIEIKSIGNVALFIGDIILEIKTLVL